MIIAEDRRLDGVQVADEELEQEIEFEMATAIQDHKQQNARNFEHNLGDAELIMKNYMRNNPCSADTSRC